MIAFDIVKDIANLTTLAGNMELDIHRHQGVLAGGSIAVVPVKLYPSTHHNSSIDWLGTVARLQAWEIVPELLSASGPDAGLPLCRKSLALDYAKVIFSDGCVSNMIW